MKEAKSSAVELNPLVKNSKDVEYVFVNEKIYENFLSLEGLRGCYTLGSQDFSIIPNNPNKVLLEVEAADDATESPALLRMGKILSNGSHIQINIGVGGKFDYNAAQEALDSLEENQGASVARGVSRSTSIVDCLCSCFSGSRQAVLRDENMAKAAAVHL